MSSCIALQLHVVKAQPKVTYSRKVLQNSFWMQHQIYNSSTGTHSYGLQTLMSCTASSQGYTYVPNHSFQTRCNSRFLQTFCLQEELFAVDHSLILSMNASHTPPR